MDALCACCAQPTPATTFPAICADCQPGARLVDQWKAAMSTLGVRFEGGNAANRINRLTVAPDPWLSLLTVGDAAWLHEMKIDPLG